MALLKGVVQDGRAALQQRTGQGLDKHDSPGTEGKSTTLFPSCTDAALHPWGLLQAASKKKIIENLSTKGF